MSLLLLSVKKEKELCLPLSVQLTSKQVIQKVILDKIKKIKFEKKDHHYRHLMVHAKKFKTFLFQFFK